MPNTRLGLRRRVEGVLNAHGERTSGGWGPLSTLEPGLASEQADSSWRLGLDPALWPVRQKDLIVSEDGQSWLVDTSDLLTNSFDSTVNWVRCTASARRNGSTLPADGWFVARYTELVEPTPPDPDGPPLRDAAGLWTGYGPPPTADFGAQEGDEYIDLVTGVVYRLGDEP